MAAAKRTSRPGPDGRRLTVSEGATAIARATEAARNQREWSLLRPSREEALALASEIADRTGRRLFVSGYMGGFIITNYAVGPATARAGGVVRVSPGAPPRQESGRPRFGSIRRPEVPDAFTRQYIETALWSSNDNSDDSGGDPLDKNYSPSDLTVDTLREMIADCEKFQAENARMLARAYAEAKKPYDAENAGHDFWLTRNGHGAGFWDRDLPKDVGDALTRASEKYGEINLYVEGGRIGSDQARATKGGHSKGTPSKSEMISRKKLGEMMGPWGGDSGSALPVLAVGSYYSGGHVYPDKTMVERAVQEIERDIPLARRGEYGWTKKDAADLATIARGLRHYLKTDYQR